jgi:hypothetical protein
VRRIALGTTSLAVLLLACGGLQEPGPEGPGAGADPDPVDTRTVGVYEAVIREMVGLEGWFTRVYLYERPCPGAGDPTGAPAPCNEPLPDAEQAALLEALHDLPRVEFVSDPEPVQDAIFDGPAGGALIRFGPIDGAGDRVEVSASAFCGGLCGHWMTLVVEGSGSEWRVTGTTGPVAIS